MALEQISDWQSIFATWNTGTAEPLELHQPINRSELSAAISSGDNWHTNMLRLVGSWVSKGNTDFEIQTMAAAHTLSGWTVEQTQVEVQKMINGARMKRFDQNIKPMPEVSERPLKPVLTMLGNIELKDPEYLIDGIVEKQSLIGLIGPSGSGKTFVALDMALSIATGSAYHGLPTKRGLVVMSAGEGHLGIPRRAEAWCKHHSHDLKVVDMAITNKAVDLFSEQSLEQFCSEVEQLSKSRGNPALIIIDTVARHMGGRDENSAKEMGELIRTADKLKDEYGCSIMLVHHTGHSDQNRARGSTAFKGALDSEMLIKRIGDHDLQLICEKQKDGPQFEPMQFIKTTVDPSIVLVQTEASASKAKRLSDNQKVALEAFHEATKSSDGASGIYLDDWRQVFNRRHTGDNQKSKDTAFRRARKELVDNGFLAVADDIYRLGDKAT